MWVLHLGRTGLTMPMPTILIQHGSRCEDHRGISYGELFRKCPEGKFWQVLASVGKFRFVDSCCYLYDVLMVLHFLVLM